MQLLPDGWIEAKAECAAEDVLAEADPLKLAWYERVDCRVTLLALANVEQLAHVDPARAAASETGRLRAVHVLVDRDARGEAVWCGAQYPTAAYAQAAGLSLEGYRELLGGRSSSISPIPWSPGGPRASGRTRSSSASRGVDELRIVAEGTDLRVRVGGRRWISASGRHNLPDGEVFTGPKENATEGVVTFAMPSAWGGQRVEGARLRFEAGRCVEAEAESGGAFLHAALDTDAVRARSASSRSASTRRSWRRRSTRSWTRRSAARCTWRSAPPTPSPAARIRAPCTGTSSAICATAARSTPTAS